MQTNVQNQLLDDRGERIARSAAAFQQYQIERDEERQAARRAREARLAARSAAKKPTAKKATKRAGSK